MKGSAIGISEDLRIKHRQIHHVRLARQDVSLSFMTWRQQWHDLFHSNSQCVLELSSSKRSEASWNLCSSLGIGRASVAQLWIVPQVQPCSWQRSSICHAGCALLIFYICKVPFASFHCSQAKFHELREVFFKLYSVGWRQAIPKGGNSMCSGRRILQESWNLN